MANHVNSYICFEEINDEAKAKLAELFGRCQEMEYGRRWFADMFVEGDVSYDDVKQYSWTTEHIGPKWCYIEDSDVSVETDTPYLMTESAWSFPEQGLVKLLEILKPLDENIVTSVSYEDEMPNFVGWQVYVGSELEDCCENDDEEIRDAIFEQNPHLREHWSEEDEDWMTDEETGDYTEEAETAMDEFRDVLYEVINDMNSEGIADTVRFIRESREEA